MERLLRRLWRPRQVLLVATSAIGTCCVRACETYSGLDCRRAAVAVLRRSSITVKIRVLQGAGLPVGKAAICRLHCHLHIMLAALVFATAAVALGLAPLGCAGGRRPMAPRSRVVRTGVEPSAKRCGVARTGVRPRQTPRRRADRRGHGLLRADARLHARGRREGGGEDAAAGGELRAAR